MKGEVSPDGRTPSALQAAPLPCLPTALRTGSGIQVQEGADCRAELDLPASSMMSWHGLMTLSLPPVLTEIRSCPHLHPSGRGWCWAHSGAG